MDKIDLADLLAAEDLIGLVVKTRVGLNGNRLESQSLQQPFDLFGTGGTASRNPAAEEIGAALCLLVGVIGEINQCFFQISLAGVIKNRVGNILAGSAYGAVIGGVFADEFSEIAERFVGIIRNRVHVASQNAAHTELGGGEILIVYLGFYHFFGKDAETVFRFIRQLLQLTQKLFALLGRVLRDTAADCLQQSHIKSVIVCQAGNAVPFISGFKNSGFFAVDVGNGTVAFVQAQFVGEILIDGFKPLLRLLQAFAVTGNILMLRDFLDACFLSVRHDQPCAAEVVLRFNVAEYFRQTLVQRDMCVRRVTHNSPQDVEVRHIAE